MTNLLGFPNCVSLSIKNRRGAAGYGGCFLERSCSKLEIDQIQCTNVCMLGV